jgi:CheY-like chemotaxis protein
VAATPAPEPTPVPEPTPAPAAQEPVMDLNDSFDVDLSLDEMSLDLEIDAPEVVEQQAPAPLVEDDIYADDTAQMPSPSQYDADILLAKKSPFENRLFKSILDDLGYSSISVDGSNALEESLENKKFKLVLFDKETQGLDIANISSIIKGKGTDTALVLMIDPAFEAEDSDTNYVHEIIKNVINKDLLRLVFEKFI